MFTDPLDNVGEVWAHYDPEIWDQAGRNPNIFACAAGTGATLARVGKLSKGRTVFGVSQLHVVSGWDWKRVLPVQSSKVVSGFPTCLVQTCTDLDPRLN